MIAFAYVGGWFLKIYFGKFLKACSVFFIKYFLLNIFRSIALILVGLYLGWFLFHCWYIVVIKYNNCKEQIFFTDGIVCVIQTLFGCFWLAIKFSLSFMLWISFDWGSMFHVSGFLDTFIYLFVFCKLSVYILIYCNNFMCMIIGTSSILTDYQISQILAWLTSSFLSWLLGCLFCALYILAQISIYTR